MRRRDAITRSSALLRLAYEFMSSKSDCGKCAATAMDCVSRPLPVFGGGVVLVDVVDVLVDVEVVVEVLVDVDVEVAGASVDAVGVVYTSEEEEEVEANACVVAWTSGARVVTTSAEGPSVELTLVVLDVVEAVLVVDEDVLVVLVVVDVEVVVVVVQTSPSSHCVLISSERHSPLVSAGTVFAPGGSPFTSDSSSSTSAPAAS